MVLQNQIFPVEETEHLWIEMSDGTRLAARLWRPCTSQQVPALLEYIPYRKTDMVRARDERNHPFFAAHGFACIRVDMRGSGDSEGHMPDMYAPEELDDARQVINWLAAQAWCNGRVGMFGTSWGGTAALQASVDAPVALKAVIAVCATHDRFEDDIHYMGGCVLSDTFEWGATLPAILASPPTSQVGTDWFEKWCARIEKLSCPLGNWLSEANQSGAYWKHGSVIHQTADLSVPILAVGGWSDRYSNSVMTLVNARPDLVWGVVGPWGHHYPDHGSPGPAMGFQQLALEWWRHFLVQEPADPPNWPRLRCWMREFDPPNESLDVRSGFWIESDAPAHVADHTILDLKEIAGSPSDWTVPNDSKVGLSSGDTGYFGRAGGLPEDQSADDARSLVFETAPFDKDVVIYGATLLNLRGAVQGGRAKVVVRVSDVAPDGAACRITYGLRQVGLEDTSDAPVSQVMEQSFDVSVKTHTTVYRVRRGHKIRVAISSSLWPLVWSSDTCGTVSIKDGWLRVPHLVDGDYALREPLPAPKDLPTDKSYSVITAPHLERWKVDTETASEIGWQQPKTQVFYNQINTGFAYETRMVHQQDRSDVLSERVTVEHCMEFERPDGHAKIAVWLDARSENGFPQVSVDLKAHWNDKPIAERNWKVTARGENVSAPTASSRTH